MLVQRLFWFWILVYTLLVVWLSLSLGIEGPQLFPHADKIFHFLAYLVFPILFLPKLDTAKSIRLIIVGIILFGAAMELGQSFIPFRNPSWLDMLANSAGVVTGTFLAVKMRGYWILQRRLDTKKSA